ncbi:hypothetical protein BJX99DRAFT_269444 [Aspergillus californicus]
MDYFKNNTLHRPSHFNFANDVVDTWAERSPPLEAMLWVSPDKTRSKALSYAHFSRQSHRIAVLLETLGASRGDVMMVVLPRVPAWWEVVTAGLRSGIVTAPATTLLTAADIEYRCRMSKAAVFVGDAASIAKVQTVRHRCCELRVLLQVDGDGDGDATPKVGPGVVDLYDALRAIENNAEYPSTRQTWDAPAMLYFTSGSTGMPKMVRHNQVSYGLAHVLTGKHWLALEVGKLCWNFTEQGWAKAAYSYIGAWTCGASLFVWDCRDTQALNTATLLDLLHRFPITTFCAPPLIWQHLTTLSTLQYTKDHPPLALAHCTSAGEPLNPGAMARWYSHTGIPIREGYGQTETSLMCGHYGDLVIRPGSMGKPLPGVPLHVITPAGKEARVDEEGELALLLGEGDDPSAFFGIYDGYVGKDGVVRRDERVITGQGRWYLTGDRATQDGDGYIWFVGRADDVINSSGYRIGPFEVESTLLSHPAVSECAVISSPDSVRGGVVKAIIVLAADYASSDPAHLIKEIQDYCKKSSAPYKYPRKIDFVSAASLPRTTSGKIQRALLRKKEWAGVSSPKL